MAIETLPGLTQEQSAKVVGLGGFKAKKFPSQEAKSFPSDSVGVVDGKNPLIDFKAKLTSDKARPITHKATKNKTPILAGGNDSDPSDSRATVAQYLSDRYGEGVRGTLRNYETVAKDYGLSGNPLTDVKTIRAGQLDVEERQSTTIRKGLARLSAPEPQGLIANIKSSLDRGFLATGLGMPAQAFSKAYDSRKDPYATKDAPNAVIVDDGAGGVNLITSNKVTIGERKELNRIKAEIEGEGARVSVIEREPDEVSMFDPEQIRQWREEVEARNYVDPEFQQSLAGQITEGFGQAGAMIPMAALGLPAALATSFGMAYQAGEDRYRETAEAKGFAYDEAAAREAGVKGLPAGFVDAVADRFVVGKILKPLKGAGKTKSELIRLLGNGLQAGVVGAGTEGLQTAYENVNAKYLSRFDADAEIPDGVIDSMIVGFAVDAGMATGGGTAKVGADKALRRWFDPVDGMSDQDMAAAQSTAKPDEISDFAEKKYGDQVDEEGTPLKDLAVDAANGDKSARDKLRNAETVEVDPTDAEAGLTAEEVEAAEFGGMESLPPEAEEDLQKRMQADERADVAEVGMESLKEHLTTLPNLEERLTLDDARDKMASFQVELNDMLAAGVDAAEVQRFAEAAVRAAGYDPADPRYAPNRMQIKGHQTSAYEKGVLKATASIFKDATPFTLLEEVNHGFYDMAVESGEVDVDTVRGWKSEIQDQNPDAPKFDDSDKGVKEWAAYEAGAWAAGERGNDMSALPEGFRRYVEMFLEFAKDVMNFVRRGDELREMAEAGMLPAGMQQFMERSMGMDTDYLIASIRDAEARASAPDPKTELKQFLKTAKVPRPDEDPTFRGELESYFESIGKNWKKMRKGINSLDELGKAMKEKGFNVDTPDDVVKLLDRSTRGEEIYPNEDSRSAATATDASYSLGGSTVTPNAATQTFPTADGGVVGPASFSLTAFHGTPHKVDKFSTEKIGTGEGAQAYGYGLYFAQNKAVADDYRATLSGISYTIDGEIFEARNYAITEKVALGKNKPDWLRRELVRYVKMSNYNDPENIFSSTDEAEKIIDALDRGALDYSLEGKGALYQVTLNVEDSELLDWDKPLSEQSDFIREKLSRFSDTMTGAEFYNRIEGDPETVSGMLSADGIKGIRYLDGASRADGEGSSNYVIFNGDDITITHENGDVVDTSAPSFSMAPVNPDSPEFKAWFGDSKVVDENGDPLVVYHGTASEFEAFDTSKLGSATQARSAEMGFFFTSDNATAKAYSNYAATDARVQAELKKAEAAERRGDWDAYDKHVVESERLNADSSLRDDMRTVEAFLSISNPMEVDAEGQTPQDLSDDADVDSWLGMMMEQARDGGHDGLIIRNLDDAVGLYDRPADHFVAFDPTQIKSATSNTGAFDPQDPRISYSMAPMEEGQSVTSRDRTPEENELAKALADWREDMTTAERKAASDRLKVLQVKAVESRKRQRLIKSAEGKYEKLFNQKTAQLRKQVEEREDLTEAVKELEALINNPKIPAAVRGRIEGYGKLASIKRGMERGEDGKMKAIPYDAALARQIKSVANRLDSEFVKYRRTENRNKLLKFLSPYSTVYAPKLRKLSARVGEESRDLLRFAADLSRNSEAPAPKGMSEASEFAMRETFGGVLTREASPEQIDMALKGAGAIAKGGRTEMEDFHKARKARIDDRNEQMKEAVLLGEDALDEDEIQRARDTMTTGEKVRSTMMGLLFHPLNGLQQMMNILDVRKGGFMEREFMSAAHEANQEEVAMNVDNAKRTTDDIVGIFKGENRVADGWFKDAQNVVQTEIEWDAGKGKRKRKLSKLQGVSIYMQWLDLSLRPTFENMGIDGETMAKVVEFIGQDGVKLGEYYRSRYAETGIDIQGVHKETEGFAMDLVDGYGGRARRAGVAKGEDDVMLAMGGKDSRATVKSGSMKERTGNTLPLLFADASVEFNQHMREANHYISHAQLTKDLQSAFKFDKDVSNAIKQVHGDEFYSSLIKKVDGIIEGGTKAKNIVERSMNTVRANLTKASLGLKPAIAIKQLTSAPAFIEEIGFTDYAKASATMARSPLKWMKLVYGTDYVKNRTNTSIYADIQQQLAMRSNMFRGATMSDMMMMNVKYGDVGGVVLGGTPVYIDTYQKAKLTMTEANAHKEAERVFGEASERAQQSSAEFSKGEYLSGQGVMRSFFMYLTSPIQYQRNINVALLNLANSVINSRAGKEADVQTARKQAVRAVIVYHFILPQIFQAVASGLTGFTSDDDEIVDQFWRRQARAAILGNLSTFPVLGQIMSGLANEISGAGEFFRSSGSPVVDFSGKAGADILRAFKSGGEAEDVVKVIEDAASLKGIPLKTGLDYAESLSELDDSDHPMLKILGWSDWAIGE